MGLGAGYGSGGHLIADYVDAFTDRPLGSWLFEQRRKSLTQSSMMDLEAANLLTQRVMVAADSYSMSVLRRRRGQDVGRTCNGFEHNKELIAARAGAPDAG